MQKNVTFFKKIRNHNSRREKIESPSVESGHHAFVSWVCYLNEG